MSTFVRAVGVLLCVMIWSLMVAAGEEIPCDKLVLAVDIESVKGCSASSTRANESTSLTDVSVDAPCNLSGSLCDTCKPSKSNLTLNYSLTDFTASSYYSLVNGRCVNSISIGWNLMLNPTANDNVIGLDNAAVDSSESVDRSSLSEEYDYSRDVNGSDEDYFRPRYNNNTVAFKLCFFYESTFGCTLAVEIRSQIPKDNNVIEFQYDCLSLKTGYYNILMFTYPKFSNGKNGYIAGLNVDGNYGSCELPSPSTGPATKSPEITPLPPPSPHKSILNDGLLILVCVISITILMIIALTVALIAVISKRSRRMRYESDLGSSGSNSSLITGSSITNTAERERLHAFT